MKSPIQWNMLAWATVCAGIALLFAFDALENLKRRREFENHAKVAKGVVTDSSKGFTTGGHEPESESPTVEYRFMVDQRDYTGRSSGEFVEIGGEIEVEYSSADPETNRMKGSISSHAPHSAFFAIFSAMFAAVFLWTTYMGPERGDTWDVVPFTVFPFIVLTAGAAVLLFCTRDGPQPFPYDRVILWVTSGISIYAASAAFRWKYPIAMVPLAALAIVFNPLWPLRFSDSVLFALHTAASIFMLICAFNVNPKGQFR